MPEVFELRAQSLGSNLDAWAVWAPLGCNSLPHPHGIWGQRTSVRLGATGDHRDRNWIVVGGAVDRTRCWQASDEGLNSWGQEPSPPPMLQCGRIQQTAHLSEGLLSPALLHSSGLCGPALLVFCECPVCSSSALGAPLSVQVLGAQAYPAVSFLALHCSALLVPSPLEAEATLEM